MEEIKKMAIGCDHAGYPYKDRIKKYLQEQGIEVLDFGTDSAESVDYPDFIHPVAEKVEQGEAQFGVILCGSGNGASMTANKHQGIRSALCWDVPLAKLAREHNDANILSLPVRFIEEETALECLNVFIHTDFEGGRHQRRVNKIPLDC
jgi:ribose 5-phosphate isomerase B